MRACWAEGQQGPAGAGEKRQAVWCCWSLDERQWASGEAGERLKGLSQGFDVFTWGWEWDWGRFGWLSREVT